MATRQSRELDLPTASTLPCPAVTYIPSMVRLQSAPRSRDDALSAKQDTPNHSQKHSVSFNQPERFFQVLPVRQRRS